MNALLQSFFSAALYAGPMQLDSRALRTTMARFPNGATVVTTGQGQNRHGMTASSFHSVSLDPPLVGVCLANQSGTLKAIQQNDTFAVNVLADNQTDTCWRFAKQGIDRFEGQKFTPGPATGAPLLEGAAARFECKVYAVIPTGDHMTVLGQILAMDSTANRPMVFTDSKQVA